MSLELTALQTNAIEEAEKWHKLQNEQFFSIHGYAGSGKSTLVEYLIHKLGLEHNVAYVTFTGKASLVLNQKGCSATTIHHLIYEPKACVINGVPTVKFEKVEALSARIKLIVIDESSMVSEEILKDLAGYKVPILAIGDPEQLPPIGKTNFLMQHCNVFLNEIHRQAANNPIIYLSMLARNHEEIPYGLYSKNVMVLRRRDLRDCTLLTADQVICGKNATRKTLNERIRLLLHGESIDHPVINDKLICLKNNWQLVLDDYPLINGMIGYIQGLRYYNSKTNEARLDFRPDFLDKRYFENIKANFGAIYNKPFKNDSELEDRDMNFFDYGYAITCHKSQGSSFNKVVVYEETLDPKMHARWLYTAITRAEKQLVLVR